MVGALSFICHLAKITSSDATLLPYSDDLLSMILQVSEEPSLTSNQLVQKLLTKLASRLALISLHSKGLLRRRGSLHYTRFFAQFDY